MSPHSTKVAVSIGVACCLCLSFSAVAESPISKLASFRRVEADPNKTYTLTEEHGPWMVFAASFSGPGAEREAQHLVFELRKRYRLPAFVHKQAYDYTGKVTGLGLNRYGEPRKMRYQKQVAFDEYAVLVGSFPTHDDPGAAKLLQALKYTELQGLNSKERESKSTLAFARLREYQRKVTRNDNEPPKGPLSHAFVTRNPLLPREYFAPHGVDALVASMNHGVENSLLDCPGKYTVQVATFRGEVLIDQKKIKEVQQLGNKVSGRLAEAAEQAHQLTRLLRKRGVEAYEFHDRQESIVTVGSFNSVGTPRNDGKTEINPAVLRTMKTYGAQRQEIPGIGQHGLAPRQLGGITFDVQPKPVEVPQRSIATDYARSRSLSWK